MSFSDILSPRPEILKNEGIQGIIDIENLRSKKRNSIESKPELFFELTYPTKDIRAVVDNLHRRFNSPGQTAGLFLLEGFKGSGKSHLELLIYHLFQNYEVAKNWLQKVNLQCNLPSDATVIIHKFTDFPLDSIWNLIFENIGAKKYISNRQPNLNELREAIGDNKIVLILDELEMGYESIANKSTQAQNLSFLQMLSEEAERSESNAITIFASIYNSTNEPGATLKRVPRVDVKFSEPQDRKQIILHRIFENYSALGKDKVESVVQSFINHWRKCGIKIDEKYIDKMYDSYPFSPEVFDVFLSRILGKNFQGNRGPLGLFSRIVRNNHKTADLITTSHFSLNDTGIRNLLIDLDPGQTFIQCAQNDLHDLAETPFANEIVSSVLIGTITSSSNTRGIKDQELVRQVIKPGDNFNDYLVALNAFEKLGAFFQRSEDSFFFDTQEKPYAKVEYRSLRIDPKAALDLALERLKKNVFNDTSAIVFRDEASVKAHLMFSDKNSLRFVISPKRLKDDDRKKIYSGIENPNTVLLIEPKTENFNAFDNSDIIKWAQLALAASELKLTTGDNDRKRQYEKIESDNLKYIDDSFKKAGFCFIFIQKTFEGLTFELEPLSNAVTKTDITEQLKRNIFPLQRIQEHLLENIELAKGNTNWVLNQSVADIKSSYKKTLGFPVLLAESNLIDAIKNLCNEKLIGLSHTRERFCGRHPNYSASEWAEVLVVMPFVDNDNAANPLFPETYNQKQAKPEDEFPSQSTLGTIVDSNNGDSDRFSHSKPISIFTINCKSTIELQRELAQKLGAEENANIKKAVFTIFLEKQNTDLGSLPASLRGQLTGLSNLHFELTIAKEGSFKKADLEQMAEQLPVFQDAFYRAELKGFVESKHPE